MVKATVVGAGVAQADQDRVTVVMFVNQTTTSTKVTGPKIDQNRITVAMV